MRKSSPVPCGRFGQLTILVPELGRERKKAGGEEGGRIRLSASQQLLLL